MKFAGNSVIETISNRTDKSKVGEWVRLGWIQLIKENRRVVCWYRKAVSATTMVFDWIQIYMIWPTEQHCQPQLHFRLIDPFD